MHSKVIAMADYYVPPHIHKYLKLPIVEFTHSGENYRKAIYKTPYHQNFLKESIEHKQLFPFVFNPKFPQCFDDATLKYRTKFFVVWLIVGTLLVGGFILI